MENRESTPAEAAELRHCERIGELTRAMQLLADLYRFLGNPHPNHQNASSMPKSTGGFDTLNAPAIAQDGNLEESTQSSTAPRWKNFSFFPITRGKNVRLYGLCALAIITAVSFVLLKPKWKTTNVAQKKTGKNMVSSFELQTSARKMKQEKNLFDVIKFKVSPQGVIYIDGEKKGVAPMLSELQVNLAPQERILIEQSFRKNTATATTKNITVSKSTSKGEKAPQKINPAAFAATATTKNITVSKSTSKGKKTPRKINPAAITATAPTKNITVSKTSIMRLSNSLVRVWVRIEDDPYSMKKAQEKEGLPAQGYDNFSHSLVLREFDCKKQTYRSIQINDYDTNGKVLWSSPVSKVIKQPIVPGSAGETLYKSVCQGSKKKKEQK
jgi:hypothetical protein